MNCFFHHKPLLFGVFRTISRGFFHNLHVFFDFVFDLMAFKFMIISTAKGMYVRNAVARLGCVAGEKDTILKANI